MPTQKWKVVVAKLGASDALQVVEVDATNWMSALRAARQAMSERPSLPSGASCSVDANGVATILDPSSQRKFVLSPIAEPIQSPAIGATGVERDPPEPEADSPKHKPKRFDTVSMIPEQPKTTIGPRSEPLTPTESLPADHSPEMEPRPVGQAPNAAAESPPKTTRVPHTESAVSADRPKSRFETVSMIDDPSAVQAHTMQPVVLELLLERDEEPTPSNPLYYRERAYLLQRATARADAEAAMRSKLAELQQALSALPRGKLVNLALFDHRWTEAPKRPPIVVLQWRDWRDQVLVDYPATSHFTTPPPAIDAPHDDRLAHVFEELENLSHVPTAAEGLDFAVRLVERMIPAEATSACLYDINTDELRFVAVGGTGAAEMQGKAAPSATGLFAQALRAEQQATLFDNVTLEASFNPEADSRVGIDPRNSLLRPIVREHQLLGMLQLINRKDAPAFSAQDVSVINYIADRLAEFLHAARLRQRADH